MEEIVVCSNTGLVCAEFCDTSAFVDDNINDGGIGILDI